MGSVLCPALTHAALQSSVAEILCASMSPSGKWANRLASNLPPRSVARINELIMFEEHFELRMKDTEDQSVMDITHN